MARRRNQQGALLLRPAGADDASEHAPPVVRKELPPLALSGLTRALGVTERDLETYKPSEWDVKVGEAFLAGHSAISAIETYTGLTGDQIKEVFNSAIAMQWISRRVEALFRSRSAVVDCSLYLRAAAGDLRAMELFYKRMKLLEEATKKVEVNYSGGVNLTAVSDDELARIVLDKTKLLPTEFKVLESKKVEDDPPK